MTHYPTEWQGGKCYGYISTHMTKTGNTWMVKVKDCKGTGKIASKYFPFTESTKDAQRKEAEKWQQKMSDELDLTLNKYRYVDKDTIEVKLVNDPDKTIFTDAKHLPIVNRYNISTTIKKDKKGNRYYVMCREKKKSFTFAQLITDYKAVTYIDKKGSENKVSLSRVFFVKDTDCVCVVYVCVFACVSERDRDTNRKKNK
jgi:hypothetical protein